MIIIMLVGKVGAGVNVHKKVLKMLFKDLNEKV